MSKDIFAGLEDMLTTSLDEEKKEISNEPKQLDSHHRNIAQDMVTDYDTHERFVEKGIEYPFVEIVGPRTKFEIEHVKREGLTEEALPLMINMGEVYAKLGTLDLTYENIIDLLSIAEYTLKLHESEEESTEISESIILTLLLT